MNTTPPIPSHSNHMARAIEKAGGQVLLASAIGVTQQAVSRALRKGVSPRMALRLAAYLNEPVEELFPALLEEAP